MYAFRVSNGGSSDYRIFLSWLSAGLEKRGKTQDGLAKALGLSQPRISEILRGKRRLQLTEIPKIAEYIEQPPPINWFQLDQPATDTAPADPSQKNRSEIRFGLHEDPNLIWILIFRDGKLIDQFEADHADLDNLSRLVTRAIQSLSNKK